MTFGGGVWEGGAGPGSARTAAESRPGPLAAGEALDGRPAQQLVASVALHLAAGPQGAPVAAAAGGAAGGLAVGQPHRVTPERV